MQRIAASIAEGAMAFLRAQYRVVALFVGAIALLLLFRSVFDPSGDASPWLAVSFVAGALCSGLAGFVGMRVATLANVRTTEAARGSLGAALRVAFVGGSVMGLGVVGLGLFGLGTVFALLAAQHGTDAAGTARTLTVLTGFSFGASAIALFARVGGGIYTKAADVGADLVGKVEAGIPEDHPLNPATVADNVGDNVGDVAGMGADLFESYVASLVAAMVLGAVFMASPEFEGLALAGVLLPLLLAGAGILCSLVGTSLVRPSPTSDPQRSLNVASLSAAGLFLAAAALLTQTLLPGSWSAVDRDFSSWGVFGAVALGLLAGVAIGFVTEYHTGTGRGPVLGIVEKSLTGAGTNVIAGLAVGMFSTAVPTLVLAVAILGAHELAGLYGIAIAAVGMLANTGIQLAVDAYGPISDNAGGIAEMSRQAPEVRERTDRLDAVGNTTAAVGKGFAIGSAALTALALFAAYKTSWELANGETLSIEITDPRVVAALLVGGMLPFVFSAYSMEAVGRAARAMIEEVRRQFREIPALRQGLEILQRNGDTSPEGWSEADRSGYEAALDSAEHGHCVEIATRSALREMVRPGLLAILSPAAVGFLGGAQMLGGLLAGVTVTGVLLALFQSNAGGAWDNAKKMIEAGCEVGGERLGKGSPAHMAAVVGDTVGDPFKDTSGPSLNILLKLMGVVALVIAPMI